LTARFNRKRFSLQEIDGELRRTGRAAGGERRHVLRPLGDGHGELIGSTVKGTVTVTLSP